MWTFVFPGQGSQYVGMGQFLAEEFKVAKEVFEEANEALSFDLKKLCFSGFESDLNLTENTQPALLAVSIATDRVLKQVLGLRPSLGAGHSVGEYSALCSAETLNLSDSIRAVRARGKAMQQAVPLGQGGMLAVMGLDLSEVKTLCLWALKDHPHWILAPANENSPGQIVLSGHSEAIEFVISQFKSDQVFGSEKRIKFIPLKVSAPFHCALMKPAEEKMLEVLSAIHFAPPRFPVVQNIDAQADHNPESIREKLVRQISGVVRWVDCVNELKKLGASRVIEVGSGKVLSGLIKKIDSQQLQTFNVNNLDDLKQLEKVAL